MAVGGFGAKNGSGNRQLALGNCGTRLYIGTFRSLWKAIFMGLLLIQIPQVFPLRGTLMNVLLGQTYFLTYNFNV